MTRIALSDGIWLNVETMGAGAPLVVLHGFTGATTNWQTFAQHLSPHFQVIAIDLLGHGLADSPLNPARYTMAHSVEDLRSVLNTLGLHKPALLGYSMGGRVALSFALEYPDCLSALILESASPGLISAPEREARIASDEALAIRLEREGLAAFVDYWESLPLFATQASLPEAVQAKVRAGRLRNNPAGLAGSLRGLGTGSQPNYWGRLASLKLPTLILAGALDSKFSAIAQQMAKLIPSAQIKIVPNAGHTIHLEQPDEFVRLVTDFLNSERK